MKKKLLITCICLGTVLTLFAKDSYRYSIDLTKLDNDQFLVNLFTPKVKADSVIFSFPKIIPGTYRNSDFGKFVSALHAFDKSGTELPVQRLNDNQWSIKNTQGMTRITYVVEDIFDSEIRHSIYPMAATNIEKGKNVVINTPGVFGFIEGMTRMPFEIEFTKPEEFYGATCLKPVRSTPTKDLFAVKNIDELYDAPMMYSVPDTASVQVGNARVLVAVYSPNQKIHAAQVADWMRGLIGATYEFLGKKLPVDKYAFLYYFKDPNDKHSFPGGGGALEHNTSSFYYLPETPGSMSRNNIVDISSHEFFHIITPLTVASKEVKEFNWSNTTLSKHLWLYEGVTEYTSHLVQAKSNINTIEEFLRKMSGKITTSRSIYKDTLSFVELSKHSADTYANQFGNVYQKGALIACSLDLQLLQLSGGKYGLRELMKDLGKRFGKDRYFEDEQLFDIITSMTYPQIRDFFSKYVESAELIPYGDYFKMAGVLFSERVERKGVSIGGFTTAGGQGGKIVVSPQSRFDEFGQLMGYKPGDELISYNGTVLTAANANQVVTNIRNTIKEGDVLEARVARRNQSGTMDTLTLKANFILSTIVDRNKLTLMPDATPEQLKIREAWLGRKE